MVATPTAGEIRLASCIGIPIAILVTWFRLFLRLKRKTFWWDDFFAVISMTGITFLWTGILIFTSPGLSAATSEHRSRHIKVVGYYFVDNGFYATIWPARVSILFTIIRLSIAGRFRQLLKIFVGLFLMTWAILDAQVWWTCESEPGWKDKHIAQCMLGKKVAIAQLITDCLADLILVVAPMYLLSTLRSKRSLKIRLATVFSSTFFTTVFSLVHAYAILHDLGYLEFMFAMVISLVVVNLTVITAWFFKLKDGDDSEPSGPSAHMNTFLKGRSSGHRSRKYGGVTTIGLSSLNPAHINIDVTMESAVPFPSTADRIKECGSPPEGFESDSGMWISPVSDSWYHKVGL
ncbi:hypothetical protein D9758_016778 [Tetrapyrgos nigripes]|uniref:Rhodopsin domain-containing protein n=1 Tax=Tetrapyrgos nigripes TaxID=182062 RepID=A0A8H5BSW6_9AGAR|nr:hypothetical protein D9758_016778 [Tetrapyrgos nigripes]